MLLAPFIYTAPESLDEAITLLKEHKDAQLLAGGQSLLTEIKLYHILPSMLVDLHKIQALHGITQRGDDTLQIGAMTTFVEIAEDEYIQKYYAALVEAVKSISDAQIRNCRTLGGTLAFNTLGADLPAVVSALKATLTISSPRGERTILADDFNAEAWRNERPKDEIILAANFPPVAVGGGSAYDKAKNRANDYALCGVATSVTLAPDGTLHECHIAVTGATRYVTRLSEAEAALNDQPATAENIEAASQIAGKLDCISDLAASAEYRAFLTRRLTKNSLTRAIARAKESLDR